MTAVQTSRYGAGLAILAILVAVASAAGRNRQPAFSRPDAMYKRLPRAQTVMLDRILRGFPRMHLARASLGPTPPGWGRGGVWVNYKVKVGRLTPTEGVQAIWEGDVAAGMLRDVSRGRRWPPVRGLSYTYVLQNGKERLDSVSAIGSAWLRGISQSSEGELRTVLEQSTAEAGVRLVSVEFAHPLGHATPEITVETDDPKAFLSDRYNNQWRIVGPINRAKPRPLAEGTFLVVQDAEGTWVTASGYAVRAASGVGTSNPVFDGRR
jgi:hypothetical protein